MNRKFFSLLTMLLFSATTLYAEPIGFTSIHSGFWWWVLAVALSILLLIIIITTINETFFSDLYLKIFGISSGIFSILGFWIIPSVWCGFVFGIVGSVVAMSFLYCLINSDWNDSTQRWDKNVYPCTWVFSSLIGALTIAAEVFVMIYLPNNWWLWKYISVAVLGAGIANILALDSHYFNQRKAALVEVILLIIDFIAFWIVFGICGWNIFSIILGIIFCVLIFISLISPFICMIIEKIKEDQENARIYWNTYLKLKDLSINIAKNPNFLQTHPEYKDLYNDNKDFIDERVEAILEENKKEQTDRILKETKAREKKHREETKEALFQRNMKAISDDVDQLEISVNKGEVNIQQLSILEKHVSTICESKVVLNENHKSMIQRKRKYLEVIFKDCQKLSDCKGSSKIRMEEILRMLNNICE